jgi:sialate O-acetylesterase
MAGMLLPHISWCQKPTPKASVAFKADEQVVYKTIEGSDLSVYLHKPKGWSSGGKYPAFVYLHGGGWAGGTLHQGMDLLATVRDHDIVGINVEYRLADAQNLDPGRCIEDAKSALRFIRSKAQLLGIDPERIAVGGHSAGGHLAAACALLPTFNAASDDPKFSCKPNALALIVPVLDNGPDRGYKSEAPAIKSNLKAYSPAHNISAGAPPTLIFAGNQDAGAALSCLERFKENMIRSGNRCDLMVYDGGHGFANQSPVKEDVNGKIVEFIRSLGWLEHKTAAIPSLPPAALAARSKTPESPLNLATIFADHMVLQRDVTVPVWGWATPASRVTVEFAGQVKTTATDASGKWRVTLDPLSASADPRTLKVRGTDPEKGEVILTREDVVVGEVWFCSGQSNMETALAGNPELPTERDLPPNPQLRAFVFRKAPAQTPQGKIPEGRWLLADSKSRGNFYAAAYFFGKNMECNLKVPVGLIQSAWGGTPVQAWMSREMLASDPEMNSIAEDGLQQCRNGLQSNQRFLAENGDPQKLPWPDWQTAKTPSFLFNAMVHPFIPYGIRGVIWYQGEHNVSDPRPYAKMFTAMIRDWRARWGLGDFPFHFCQLPGLKMTAAKMTGNIALLRAMQAKALELPNTGMAVLYDTAEEEDNHPKDKRTVGERLARLVLRQTFGHPIECYGPTYTGISVQGNQVVVHFQHVGSGLLAKEIPATYKPVRSRPDTKPVVRMSPDSPLEGFQVRARNGPWHWANAKIVGQTVMVQSEQVPQPFAVRYAWSDFGFFNLFNEGGFPAPPFSSEILPAQQPASAPAP